MSVDRIHLQIKHGSGTYGLPPPPLPLSVCPKFKHSVVGSTQAGTTFSVKVQFSRKRKKIFHLSFFLFENIFPFDRCVYGAMGDVLF